MTIHRELSKLNNINKRPIILEIGAHIGTDTVKIAKVFPNAKYFAVEPDFRNHRPLLNAIEKAQESKPLLDITLVPLALSDRPGMQTFYTSHGWIERDKRGKGREHTDSSSLMKPKPIIWEKRPWVSFRELAVECITLDGMCRTFDIGWIDFIWMDVQGAEAKIIKGGQWALSHTKYLYTETQSDRYEGQPGLDKILELLPGKWDVMRDFVSSALLKKVG